MSCNYPGLLATLKYYATGEWTTPEPCPETPTHYTCVGFTAGDDFPGEKYTNVCATHEPQVRTLTGWRWSRPKQEVSL